MKRSSIILIAVISLILIVIGVILFIFFYLMGKPLYIPGELSKTEITTEIRDNQNNESPFWIMDDGIALKHFFTGEGEDILFIHGYPIAPVLKPHDALTKLSGYKVHYYQWRGCGLSDRPVDEYSSENFYENMLDLDNKLGITRLLKDIEQIRKILGKEKLTIIGHSYGGFLASLYAAEFPENIKNLVLIAPANILKMPQDNGGLYEVVKQTLKGNDKNKFEQWLKLHFDYNNIFTRSEKELIDINLGFIPFYAKAAQINNIPFKEEAWNREMAGGWVVHAVNFSLGQKYDLTDFISNISAPTLLLHGTDDLNGPAESDTYINSIQNIQVELIKNSGHFIYDDQPELFTSIVEKFISKH